MIQTLEREIEKNIDKNYLIPYGNFPHKTNRGITMKPRIIKKFGLELSAERVYDLETKQRQFAVSFHFNEAGQTFTGIHDTLRSAVENFTEACVIGYYINKDPIDIHEIFSCREIAVPRSKIIFDYQIPKFFGLPYKDPRDRMKSFPHS